MHSAQKTLKAEWRVSARSRPDGTHDAVVRVFTSNPHLDLGTFTIEAVACADDLAARFEPALDAFLSTISSQKFPERGH